MDVLGKIGAVEQPGRLDSLSIMRVGVVLTDGGIICANTSDYITQSTRDDLAACIERHR